ncbi:MAG: DUF1667 domain-containing protein [Tissierellaceae bacterium]|nr:DUF1667 domain-containing protein [Tissierellaceae bacterium]
MYLEKRCLVCPVGCILKIEKDGDSDYLIRGNKCGRGKDFAIKEMKEPSRVLTSRVILKNGPMSRLPVKTSDIIPQYLVDKCMEIIRTTEVTAPVKMGQIIIENILNTNINVVAARKVNSTNPRNLNSNSQ